MRRRASAYTASSRRVASSRTPAPRNSSATSSRTTSSSPARSAGSGGAKPSARGRARGNPGGPPVLGAGLPVGAVQPLGRGHYRRVQERERQGAPIDQRDDG